MSLSFRYSLLIGLIFFKYSNIFKIIWNLLMNKNILLSLLMLIPIVSNAKNDLVKGKLIYQNEDIKLYADTPKKEFDDKIEKNVLMVRAVIDNKSSKNYQLVYYMFDCEERRARSLIDGILINKQTNKDSIAPKNMYYNSNSYNPVVGESATSIYFKYTCKA